jgi:hypothetical protein
LRFVLTQHTRDTELINSLKKYLNCGKYHARSNRNFGEFIVEKFSDITEKIIPFFDKYPLTGIKSKDFQDFKQIAELMKNKTHLTPDGLKKIKKIKLGMNSSRLNEYLNITGHRS